MDAFLIAMAIVLTIVLAIMVIIIMMTTGKDGATEVDPVEAIASLFKKEKIRLRAGMTLNIKPGQELFFQCKSRCWGVTFDEKGNIEVFERAWRQVHPKTEKPKSMQ